MVVPVANSGVESRRRMPQTRLTRPMDTGLAQASNETSWRHKKKRRGVRESSEDMSGQKSHPALLQQGASAGSGHRIAAGMSQYSVHQVFVVLLFLLGFFF